MRMKASLDVETLDRRYEFIDSIRADGHKTHRFQGLDEKPFLI